MNDLPSWVKTFNGGRVPDRYLSKKWNTLYDKSTYIESTADDTDYENGIKNGVKATLPLNLPTLYNKYGYNIIRNTPFGNSLTNSVACAQSSAASTSFTSASSLPYLMLESIVPENSMAFCGT